MSDAKRQNGLKRNLGMLVVAIVVMTVSLGGSLWWALATMGENAERVSQELIPMEHELGAMSDGVGKAFSWQSRVNASRNTAQLQALEGDKPASNALTQHLDTIGTLLNKVNNERANDVRQGVKALRESVSGFEQQQNELLTSVERKHKLQEEFNQRVGESKTHVLAVRKTLIKFQGLTKLAAMAEMARVDDQIMAGGLGNVSRKNVLTLTRGDTRVIQAKLNQLNTVTLRLGIVIGKIGLCNDPDELNAILANEMRPTVSTLGRLYAELGELTAPYHNMEALRVKAQDGLSRVLLASVDPNTESMMVLRKQILEEMERSERTRQNVQASAGQLSLALANTQKRASLMVKAMEAESHQKISIARWVALLAGLAALLACALALGRIVVSVRELKATNEELARLRDGLRDANEGLERKVALRTQELAATSRAVKRLLDGLGEGVVEISLEGDLSKERSLAFETWFGSPPEDARAWDVLFPGDDLHAEGQRMFFEMGLEQMADGWVPFELCAHQMPPRSEVSGRVLEFTYKPVYDEPEEGEEAELKGMLIVASDITALLEAERENRKVAQIQRMVSYLFQDKEGFLRFVDDGGALVHKIAEAQDADAVKMPLHTLKGNCAVYGAAEVADVCHHIEDDLEEAKREGTPRSLTEEEVKTLRSAWEQMLQDISHFFGERDEDNISLERTQIEEVAQALFGSEVPGHIVMEVESWLLEPARDNLDRLAMHARRIAKTLHKEVDVQVIDNGVRVSNGFAAELWPELIHLIRNSLDHGIEEPDERQRAKKRAEGQLMLEVDVRDDRNLMITVYDDGQGVQWDALARKAASMGMPTETHEDLVDAMFASGLSTRESANEISGRGVGMAAIKDICEQQGGKIEVLSVPGRGTLFSILLPLPEEVKAMRCSPEVAHHYRDLLAQHSPSEMHH